MNNKFHDLNGEKKDQLLVVVDKRGDHLGLATRDECHMGNGKPHLAFMAFVVDREGKIILARRSRNKSLWGGFWDASVVSHVLPGETAETAAKRRGKEELGIDVDFEDLGAFYYFEKFDDSCENEYCHVLIGKTILEVDFNPVEIIEIRIVTYNELVKEIGKNPKYFTPWLMLSIEKVGLKKYL